MLARKNLIPLRKEFPRLRKTGKGYNSLSFGLIVSYRKANSQPRGAFIVSKKIDRRSVIRHKVKRRLSDAVAPFLPRLPKNLELVFLAKKKAVETSREELKSELQLVLRRARLL